MYKQTILLSEISISSLLVLNYILESQPLKDRKSSNKLVQFRPWLAVQSL